MSQEGPPEHAQLGAPGRLSTGGRFHRVCRMARSAPEAVLAGAGFILNAVWEFVQSPLYTDHCDPDHSRLVRGLSGYAA